MMNANSANNLTYGILCCNCGTPIQPNPTSMCLACIRSRINITEGVDTEQSIQCCKDCGRYNVGNNRFLPADLESPQLLGICLKKVRGTKDLRLTDAGFIWTEPHSRRINVRMTFQKEVVPGAVLQQDHMCVFHVHSCMCDDCQASYTDHTWKCCVQVRQKVSHKRTFLYLEQVIIRNRDKLSISSVEEQPTGLDFFFTEKSAAYRFIDLLYATVPGRHSLAQKLISADLKSNTANIKLTIIFEIAPVCRDDLVVLPQAVSTQLGYIGPICIVSRVASRIHLVDPFTGRNGFLTPQQYFSNPFTAVRSRQNLIELFIIDNELIDEKAGVSTSYHDGFRLAHAEVQREIDFESGKTLFTRTHLGNLAQPGKSVAGYDLTTCDLSDYTEVIGKKMATIPPVVIVAKWSNNYGSKNKGKRANNKVQGSTSTNIIRLETADGLPVIQNANQEDMDYLEELYEDPEFNSELQQLAQQFSSLTISTNTQNAPENVYDENGNYIGTEPIVGNEQLQQPELYQTDNQQLGGNQANDQQVAYAQYYEQMQASGYDYSQYGEGYCPQ